jgi:hypothetical protein
VCQPFEHDSRYLVRVSDRVPAEGGMKSGAVLIFRFSTADLLCSTKRLVKCLKDVKTCFVLSNHNNHIINKIL